MPNRAPPEPILTEDAKFAALFDLFAAYFAGTPQWLSAQAHDILKAKCCTFFPSHIARTQLNDRTRSHLERRCAAFPQFHTEESSNP